MFDIQLHNQSLMSGVQQTISGRDIHEALGIGKDYTNWTKEQIESLQLIENVDYVVYAEKGVNPKGGRPRSEYYFTLDMAKHLALASRTEKGRAYRQALIDMEKSVALISLGTSPSSQAVGIIQDYIKIAELFGAPQHIGLIEAAKAVKHLGIDAAPLLQASPYMDNIPQDQKWLEPTELGKRHGMSGKSFNRLLQAMGLQSRVNGVWIAAESAKGTWMEHSWEAGTKSGYNYKWHVAKVEALMREYLEHDDGARFV